MSIELDELNRRGAIAAAACLATGVLVNVGSVLILLSHEAEHLEAGPSRRKRPGF